MDSYTTLLLFLDWQLLLWSLFLKKKQLYDMIGKWLLDGHGTYCRIHCMDLSNSDTGKIKVKI